MGKGAKANVRAIAAKEQAVTMLRAVLGRDPTEAEVDKALGAVPKPAVVVQGGGKVAVAKAEVAKASPDGFENSDLSGWVVLLVFESGSAYRGHLAQDVGVYPLPEQTAGRNLGRLSQAHKPQT